MLPRVAILAVDGKDVPRGHTRRAAGRLAGLPAGLPAGGRARRRRHRSTFLGTLTGAPDKPTPDRDGNGDDGDQATKHPAHAMPVNPDRRRVWPQPGATGVV